MGNAIKGSKIMETLITKSYSKPANFRDTYRKNLGESGTDQSLSDKKSVNLGEKVTIRGNNFSIKGKIVFENDKLFVVEGPNYNTSFQWQDIICGFYLFMKK